MRLTNHLFYALATLIGVSLIALQDPSVGLLMAQQSGDGAQMAACRDDRLDRPCNPGARGGILRGGYVVAR